MSYPLLSLVFLLLGVTWLNWESVRNKKTTLIRLWLSSLVNLFRLTLTVILLRLLCIWVSVFICFCSTYFFGGSTNSYTEKMIGYMGHSSYAKEILMDETLSLECATCLVKEIDFTGYFLAVPFFFALRFDWILIVCCLLYIIKYGPDLNLSKLSILRRSRPLFFYLSLLPIFLCLLASIYTFWGMLDLIKLFPVKILIVTAICNCLSYFWLNLKLILYSQACNSPKKYLILVVLCAFYLFTIYEFCWGYPMGYRRMILEVVNTPTGLKLLDCYELYFYNIFLGLAFLTSYCSNDDIEIGKKPSIFHRTLSAPNRLETAPWPLSDPVREQESVKDDCVEESKEDSLNFLSLRFFLDPALLKDLDPEYISGLEKDGREYVPYFPTPWDQKFQDEFHTKSKKAFFEMRNHPPLYFKNVPDLENYRLSLENQIEFSKKEIARCLNVRALLSGNVFNTALGVAGDVCSHGNLRLQVGGLATEVWKSGYATGELAREGCLQANHARQVLTVRTCEAEAAVVDAIIKIKKAEPAYMVSSAISKVWVRLWG